MTKNHQREKNSYSCVNKESETKDAEVIVVDNIKTINDDNQNSLSHQHSQSILKHPQFSVQDELPCCEILVL